jgi:serine---pyruvate transaminase
MPEERVLGSREMNEMDTGQLDPFREQVLVSPGPTQVPPDVLEVLARPLLHHRAPQFRAAFRGVRSGLQKIAQTENPVLLLACTGTGAMESAIVNLCAPGDAVLVPSAGYFGERWIELAERYGCDVVPLRYEWGQIPSAEDLDLALRARPDVKAVFLVHSETSTGVVIDLERFAAVAKSVDVLLVVDSVSSFAAVPIQTDAWDIDVLLSSSHKALMTPPGLAFLILSPRALEAANASPIPRFYLDWGQNLATQLGEEPETWFSAATSLVSGLEAALARIGREGLDTVYERHAQLGRRCRSRVKALELELFSPDDDTAVVLSAVRMPPGIDSTAVVRVMHDRWGITVADGEARLKGNIVRIGHLGYVSEDDVDRAVQALGAAVEEVGASRRTELAAAPRVEVA